MGEDAVVMAIRLLVKMPFVFKEKKQEQEQEFRSAVASAAGTSADKVEIVGVKDCRPKKSGEAPSVVDVETKIRADDEDGLRSLKQKLETGDTAKLKKNIGDKLKNEAGLERSRDVMQLCRICAPQHGEAPYGSAVPDGELSEGMGQIILTHVDQGHLSLLKCECDTPKFCPHFGENFPWPERMCRNEMTQKASERAAVAHRNYLPVGRLKESVERVCKPRERTQKDGTNAHSASAARPRAGGAIDLSHAPSDASQKTTSPHYTSDSGTCDNDGFTETTPSHDGSCHSSRNLSPGQNSPGGWPPGAFQNVPCIFESDMSLANATADEHPLGKRSPGESEGMDRHHKQCRKTVASTDEAFIHGLEDLGLKESIQSLAQNGVTSMAIFKEMREGDFAGMGLPVGHQRMIEAWWRQVHAAYPPAVQQAIPSWGQPDDECSAGGYRVQILTECGQDIEMALGVQEGDEFLNLDDWGQAVPRSPTMFIVGEDVHESSTTHGQEGRPEDAWQAAEEERRDDGADGQTHARSASQNRPESSRAAVDPQNGINVNLGSGAGGGTAPRRRVGQEGDDDTPCETHAVFTGCEAVDAYLSIVWDYLVPAAVKQMCPWLLWHWWFLAFFLDFVGDAWFTIATLWLRRDELAIATSPAAALVMIIFSSLSVALSLAVLCVRLLSLRPLMASIGWRYPKDELLEDDDPRKEPAFEALKLEKRVGWATALLEDIPQAVMSVVAAVYLQEVTPDMALYRATGGDAWHRREGWGSAHVDLSKWRGVRLDRPGPQGRVVALSLHRNNLRGEIPREFVEAMDALGVVPGLWGNPELSGMPKRWWEKQWWLEFEAAREYDKRLVGKIDVLKAAAEGKVDQVISYMAEGGRLNVRDTYENTPLHFAAFEGHEQACKVLLEGGAEVNARDKDEGTPLHKAAFEGHEPACKVLVEGGAEVNARDKDGNTPLHKAAFEGHEQACKVLLEGGAEVNARDKIFDYTPLHKAAFKGHEQACKVLVEGRAEVNARDKDGNTPLHKAAFEGHEQACKVLLEGGAEVNARDKIFDYTPLHWAAFKGHEQACKVLLEGGAEVNARDKDGRTPLKLAEDKGHQGVALVLQQADSSLT